MLQHTPEGLRRSGGKPATSQPLTLTRTTAVDFTDENASGERLDSAMASAEYGLFHMFLWVVCGGAYISAALVPNIINVHVSSVQCDVHLSDADKIIINCVTYGGMLSGCLVWGLISDTYGRRLPLCLSLLLNSASAFALCFSSGVTFFVVCRFFSSFSSSGSIVTALTYLAELQTSGTRGPVISFMQIFWVLGCFAVAVIPLPWTTLAALAGTLAFLPGVLGLIVLPESPRFLLSKGKREEALKSLCVVFTTNTNFTKEYQVKYLLDNETADEIYERVADEKLVPQYLRPKRFCILVLLLSKFVFTFGFYSLSLRVPRMLTRYEHIFHHAHDSSNCILGEHPTRQQQHILMMLVDPSYSATGEPPWPSCSPGSNPQHIAKMMLLLSIVTIPAIVCLAYNIDQLGRKFFLIISHVAAGFMAFFWFLSQDATSSVILAAMYQAVILVSVVSKQCLAVEIVGTKLRATYVACVLGIGRLGFVAADLCYLLNLNVSCIGLDIFVCALFILSGALILSLPDTTGIPLR